MPTIRPEIKGPEGLSARLMRSDAALTSPVPSQELKTYVKTETGRLRSKSIARERGNRTTYKATEIDSLDF